jgi:Flp pilus assembly protein TadG
MTELLREIWQDDEGQNIAEAALTLPIVLSILFGILMFGRAFNIYQTITDGAREGARYATQPCSASANALDCSGATVACTYGTLPSRYEVQGCVQQYLDASHINGSIAKIDIDYPTNNVNGVPLSYTSVRVKVPFNMLYLPFNVNIKTQSVMRNETN